MNVADSGSTTGTDLFDGYNARMMRPAEVAQTFIPPQHSINLSTRTTQFWWVLVGEWENDAVKDARRRGSRSMGSPRCDKISPSHRLYGSLRSD